MELGLVRLATGEGVARDFPKERRFGPPNYGLQQTPSSRSLGRHS
jgi:hypothetical protein